MFVKFNDLFDQEKTIKKWKWVDKVSEGGGDVSVRDRKRERRTRAGGADSVAQRAAKNRPLLHFPQFFHHRRLLSPCVYKFAPSVLRISSAPRTALWDENIALEVLRVVLFVPRRAIYSIYIVGAFFLFAVNDGRALVKKQFVLLNKGVFSISSETKISSERLYQIFCKWK